ncbi:MAG: hypothetical protein EXQ59_03345 [Acidobacteria bacterium]|nr:hypothetical protein [Acidobacteriota bacterium]
MHRHPGTLARAGGSGANQWKRTGPSSSASLSVFVYSALVDERQFFTEKPEQRPAKFQCPRCRRTNEYTIRWVRRTKKTHIPGGGDARDRVLFDKSKDHLIRVDDDVTCNTCGKRFEIPSHRALVFLEELEGLPKEDYDE